MKTIVRLTFLWLTLYYNSTTLAESELTIGALLPLSGELAALGSECQKGIELALSESESIRPKIVYEDIRSLSPKDAVSAARKVLDVDNVSLGLTMIIEDSEPMAPLFNQKEVPLLVLWDSNRTIQNAGKYIFGTGFSTEKAGEKMADYASKTLLVKKIAMVKHLSPYVEIISKAFREQLASHGGSIILDIEHNPSDTDYRSSLLKVKNSDADALYFPLIPMNSVAFLKQLRELKIELPLLSIDGLIPEVVEAAQGAAEGVYLTTIYAEQEEQLTTSYKKKYHTAPINLPVVALGYDGTKKILKALKQHNSSGDMYTALIDTIGPTKSSDREQKLFQVKNGRYTPLESDR